MDYDEEGPQKVKIYSVYKMYVLPHYPLKIYEPEFEKLYMFQSDNYDDCVMQVRKHTILFEFESEGFDKFAQLGIVPPAVVLKCGEKYDTYGRHNSRLDAVPLLLRENSYIYRGTRDIIKNYFKKYPIEDSNVFFGFLIEGKWK